VDESDGKSAGWKGSFADAQIRRLGSLVKLSRELTGDHFKMGHEEALRVPYEIRTLEKLADSEIHESGVLADIARYQYTEPRFGRKRDLYRVNLQDHNILAVLGRRPRELNFSPLVLYVLTHEIIHVIRFVKFMAPFHQDAGERSPEERTVHALTRSILSHIPLRGMKTVLDHYERHYAEPIEASAEEG
jgi:hypothetical protein